MSESTVNVPLLRKAVEWAEAEAAKPAIDCLWNQESWTRDPETRARRLARDFVGDEVGLRADFWNTVELLQPHCGTSHCIAGYVAQSLDARYATEVWPEGMPHVAQFAADALGIEVGDYDYFAPESGHLFHNRNSIEDVRRIAESLAGERL